MLESLNTAMAVQTGTAMNEQVQGLILKQLDFKEYDVILTVLFREYGKLSLKAGGVRKMTSKNAGAILPYTKAEFSFDYLPDKTMFRMKTARTKKLYRSLHEDYDRSIAAAVIAEAAEAFSLPGLDGENRQKVYDLVEKSFDLIESGDKTDTVLALFLTDMMKLFGIEPDVDECVRDGNQLVAAISAADGGFLCSSCAAEEGLELSSSQDLKRFRLLVKGGLEHYDIISKAGGAERKDISILVGMIRTHAGITLKSYRLYDRFGI